MSRITIASLVSEYNALAASFDDVKTLSPKTSLARATIIDRLDALRERAAATTETITLVELAARHGAQALSRPPAPSKLRSLLAQRPPQDLRGAA